MIGKIHPGLLIAGGIGTAGVGYLMFKPKGDKADEGAATDPAATGAAPAANAAGSTMAPGTGMVAPFADAASAASSGMPDTGASAGSGAGQLQGEQVGPYTVVKDASGVDIVFETATQQPVGVLDGQGNLRPVTVGPDGSLSLAAGQPTTAATLGPAPHPGAGSTSGATLSAPATESDAVYARMAAELFAGASPSAGTAQATAGASQVQSQQVDEFTLVGDPAGTREVYDTVTRQLLGTIDPAGNVTPAAGIAGPAASTPTGATGPATPAAMGAAVPASPQGALPMLGG